MVDMHVHLRDWGQEAKETVAHGLAMASKAGIHRVADMPNTAPALTDRDTVLDRLALASEPSRRHHVAYSVFMGLTADPGQVREAVSTWQELFPLVVGLKMFAGHSTGGMGLVSEAEQALVFRTLAEAGYDGILAIHCEKESLLKPDLYKPGCFETHSDARPAQAEVESVCDMIRLSKEAGFKGGLHICHISTAGALELVKEAKASGVDISCAATAHHALLTREDAKEHGRYLKMNPPLRDEADRAAIYRGLVDGLVDFVESDHAPHTLEDKEEGASGIPGFEGTLHLLARLKEDGVPTERLEDLFSRNATRRYGLADEEGRLLPDSIGGRIRTLAEGYPFQPWSR